MKKATLLLILLLVLALFFRTFRISDLMGFYFDQGRDALVIWDLIHKGKIFLIGPTTGIEGIFLGPFYYYLIAPLYALGNGNPVYPAFSLAIINVLGIAILYYIGSLYFNRAVGFLAVIISTFSIGLIVDHRWLSNPTPLPLFSLLTVLSLFKIVRNSTFWWLILGLSIGLSLQLEAASAVFFIPATLIILIINKSEIKFKFTSLVFSIISFGVTLLPQIYFNFRHDQIIFQAFKRFLISEKSFQPLLINFLPKRLDFYFDSFTRILFTDKYTSIIFIIFLLFLLIKLFSIFPKKSLSIILTWWLTPIVLLLFYHGNNGYVWGYYFTGVYPVFILLVSIVCVYSFTKYKIARPFLIMFLLLFFYQNISEIKANLFRSGPAYISLTTSTEAIDWMYSDAVDEDFNLDVYVPPVIPYSYQYLALWRGETKFSHQPKAEQEKLLYTIHEPDGERPLSLNKWLDRQDTYGPVVKSVEFGIVTIEKRIRI